MKSIITFLKKILGLRKKANIEACRLKYQGKSRFDEYEKRHENFCKWEKLAQEEK